MWLELVFPHKKQNSASCTMVKLMTIYQRKVNQIKKKNFMCIDRDYKHLSLTPYTTSRIESKFKQKLAISNVMWLLLGESRRQSPTANKFEGPIGFLMCKKLL